MDIDFEDILYKQFNEKYYEEKELEYSRSINILLNPFEYQTLLLLKEDKLIDNEHLIKLPLIPFNYKSVYYSPCNELVSLISSSSSLMNYDDRLDKSDFNNKFASSLYKSRIYSEIEGSLNVENVPTTRRRLIELIDNNEPPKNKNDIIIKNMALGIKFVESLPEFNKDNLYKLYNILSKDCLDEEDKLKDGDYYRYDTVEIDRYHGSPVNKIEECMNSLFDFVDQSIKSNDLVLSSLLPHICHYYLIYIHPYFDYNGRTARMVSYWVYLLMDKPYIYPPIISEAINQNKSDYYKAIELSRDSHNDLTYFLIYIFKMINSYILAYRNVEHISSIAKEKNIILTDTELSYIKKILVSYKGIFNYSDFIKMCNLDITKQGALKILNNLVDASFLVVVNTKAKSKYYDINKESIAYSLNKK